MSMVFCRGCGKEIHESAKACPQCGATQVTAGSKNRISAALLAFFLGGIGVHKFYLGKVGQGFLYLIFSGPLFRQLSRLSNSSSICAIPTKTSRANMADTR